MNEPKKPTLMTEKKQTAAQWNGQDPASPVSEDRYSSGVTCHYGLTKREFIATEAMKGILSNPDRRFPHLPQSVAKTALEHADALLEALHPEPQEKGKAE